jgi:hypothetical protein
MENMAKVVSAAVYQLARKDTSAQDRAKVRTQPGNPDFENRPLFLYGGTWFFSFVEGSLIVPVRLYPLVVRTNWKVVRFTPELVQFTF